MFTDSKIIRLEKDRIVRHMANPRYGRYWLVVSAAGEWRTAWTSGESSLPGIGPEDYLCLLPAGLYEDEMEAIARGIVDSHPDIMFDFIAVATAVDGVSGLDYIQYCAIYQEGLWRERTGATRAAHADAWLNSINGICDEDEAPWGVDMDNVGRYLPIVCPFVFAWAPTK